MASSGYFSVEGSSSVGIKSSPIQNLGGIGRSSRSSFADVDGDVKGRGTCPPRSAVEQEARQNGTIATIPSSLVFMVIRFKFREQGCPENSVLTQIWFSTIIPHI